MPPRSTNGYRAFAATAFHIRFRCYAPASSQRAYHIRSLILDSPFLRKYFDFMPSSRFALHYLLSLIVRRRRLLRFAAADICTAAAAISISIFAI